MVVFWQIVGRCNKVYFVVKKDASDYFENGKKELNVLRIHGDIVEKYIGQVPETADHQASTQKQARVEIFSKSDSIGGKKNRIKISDNVPLLLPRSLDGVH